MERMQIQWPDRFGSIRDLETFVRRADVLSDDELNYFLIQYLHGRNLHRSLPRLKEQVLQRIRRTKRNRWIYYGQATY